ncbi:hypothetical protein ACLB2K_052287 [Fragaria x ananassa]
MYQSQGENSKIPEFQVLFNDHTSNDFNTLFESFPENRRYYAAGVPGSFYSRIFPSASIHLVHSSYAIHWLSRVPKEVLDRHSPAWNKGRIHYLNASDEVVRAYKAQYVKDMECFLHARAQEIVCGGLMVLTYPGRPDGSRSFQAWANLAFQVLGLCLMDLVTKGVVSEEKVDSFNMPIYSMTPLELEAAVKQNGSFSTEMMTNLPDPLVDDTLSVPQLLASQLRASMGGMIKKHFGEEILDELFDLYRQKCEQDMLAFLAVLGHNFLIQYAKHRETKRSKDMAADNTNIVFEAHPMKGGDGPNSYMKNSILQRGSVDAAKELLNKAIAEKLDIEIFLPSKSFHIADLGCSTGPNTFLAVENILEAVESKYQSLGLKSQIPEFLVFFNDHISNDFNMLFQSLPQNRRYHAAGVPGSFYKRVFPNASINFAYSSTAIQWLSRVPTVIEDSTSPAWNKECVHYSNATDEVIKAYETQYSDDMESFLQARAQEIVYGGLIVLTFPGRHSDTPHSDATPNVVLQLLGSSLMDLVRKGVVREEKVDSFNIPVYSMSPKELSDVVERNGCFSIEMVADLLVSQVEDTSSMPKLIASHIRAGMEGLLKQHFGEEILDELFDLYQKKCEDHISTIISGKAVNFLVVLKRKEDRLET